MNGCGAWQSTSGGSTNTTTIIDVLSSLPCKVVEGGAANTTYLATQNIDGGSSATNGPRGYDGGLADG